MCKFKFLILGAGPSGLAFANRLLEKGESDFLVLESEKEAGGLCRSVCVDDAPLDIGGGHFLDTKRPEVNKFLFQFMPRDEWNIFERDSRILIGRNEVHHPIEANIWQFDMERQIEYLKSIAQAGCNTGEPKPQRFMEWIRWKLGDKITDEYMIPYNMKVFGNDLEELGTYWLEKLPNVSFEETIRSCLMQRAYGTEPGHAQFYYPKEAGYGELWKRMAHNLGDKIRYNEKVTTISLKKHRVSVESGEYYDADMIVTTIPWNEIAAIDGLRDDTFKLISKLKYSSVQIDYIAQDINSSAHWIYEPNLDLGYHRILLRKNFALGSKGYWTETNYNRIKRNSLESKYHHLNKYAYPLNTIEKPMIMEKLLREVSAYEVYGLGRWGEHQHYNSDVAVERGLYLADKLLNKNS